jgi:hypothetical protein
MESMTSFAGFLKSAKSSGLKNQISQELDDYDSILIQARI